MAFLGRRRYQNFADAHEAARFAAFLAGQSDQFQAQNGAATFSFQLVFRPADYSNYLQAAAESPADYRRRREALLDHLLARFAEDFADFALIQFARFGATI